MKETQSSLRSPEMIIKQHQTDPNPYHVILISPIKSLPFLPTSSQKQKIIQIKTKTLSNLKAFIGVLLKERKEKDQRNISKSLDSLRTCWRWKKVFGRRGIGIDMKEMDDEHMEDIIRKYGQEEMWDGTEVQIHKVYNRVMIRVKRMRV